MIFICTKLLINFFHRFEKLWQKILALVYEWYRCGFKTKEPRWRKFKGRVNRMIKIRTTTTRIMQTKMKLSMPQILHPACVPEVSTIFWYRKVKFYKSKCRSILINLYGYANIIMLCQMFKYNYSHFWMITNYKYRNSWIRYLCSPLILLL